jgi:endonuclease-3
MHMNFFDQVWKGIQEMRERVVAPVDTMGCHKLARGLSPQAHRFQLLVALLLSSQTKDEITAQAMRNLQKHFHDRFDCEAIAGTSVSVLEKLIYPVGFYRRKAQYLKQIAAAIIATGGGDIPDSVEGLVGLPGIGPKMAHLAMLSAWNKVTGIGVDVHVLRISNRLGWIEEKDPEKGRQALELVVPRDKWPEINVLLVGFGQTICLPRNPKCGQCKVSQWCKYYNDNNQW